MLTYSSAKLKQNYIGMKRSYKSLLIIMGLMFSFIGCSSDGIEGLYDYELTSESNVKKYRGTSNGIFILEEEDDGYSGVITFNRRRFEMESMELSGNELSAEFEKWAQKFSFKGTFTGDEFNATLTSEKIEMQISGKKQSGEPIVIDRSHVQYILPENALKPYERSIDHAGIIVNLDRKSFSSGERIYNSNCINCHGGPDIEGSLPLSTKFWNQPFKSGGDPYTMYQTITRGVGQMVPILTLTPKEKYSVINYIRQEFVREGNEEEFYDITTAYLAGLPEGSSRGPEPAPYNPWSDQDYGNFFMNTIELVDAETGPERYHSPAPTPYVEGVRNRI